MKRMILLRIFKFQISLIFAPFGIAQTSLALLSLVAKIQISDWGGEPVEPRYPQLSAVGDPLNYNL